MVGRHVWLSELPSVRISSFLKDNSKESSASQSYSALALGLSGLTGLVPLPPLRESLGSVWKMPGSLLGGGGGGLLGNCSVLAVTNPGLRFMAASGCNERRM